MKQSEHLNIDQLLRDLRSGHAIDTAAAVLWSHYEIHLRKVAANCLRGSSYSQDAEDVVSVVFALFCRQIRAGRLAGIETEESAGRMLAIMITQKAATLVERERRQKRGGGRVVTESALGSRLAEGFSLDLFPDPFCVDDSSAFPSWVMDQIEMLGSATLQLIVLRKVEGYSNQEISQELGCGLRTVERYLKTIREQLTLSDQDH